MSYFSFDGYWARREAEQAMRKTAEAQEALDHALAVARGIVDDCVQSWQSAGSSTGLTVDIGSSDYEAPLFIFRLLLDLDEDFDTTEFPSEEFARLQADLRARVIASEVDYWDWIVTASCRPRARET